MFGFHVLDIILALIAVFLIIRGCRRGLVGEAVSLIAFIFAVVFSFRYSAPFGDLLKHTFGLKQCTAQLSAIVIIWLLIMILASIVKMIFRSALSATNLNGLDALLGILSGMFKFIVIVYCFIIAGFLLTPVCSPVWMTNSEILRYAGRHWPVAKEILVKHHMLAHAGQLPSGTLEQELRPYRKGTKAPR